MKEILISISILLSISCAAQKDYNHPIPSGIKNGEKWELQKAFSSDFINDGKDDLFYQYWKDGYIGNWKGPGLSYFTADHSSIENGNLVLHASRKKGTKKVNCGIISSKQQVIYPVYIEARIKPSNQVLSSNIWLLSADSKRELDILEIYAGDRPSEVDNAKKASHNYHVFIREHGKGILENFSKPQRYVLPNEEPYRNDFHNFGMHWISPTEIDFYIDGKKVSQLRKEDMTDPDQLYFDRPMHIIIDTEDHDWRSKKGIIATDEELADESKNKMYVDWIRVHKPLKR